MKKKILAAVVCSAMVLSLTACGKSEEPVNGISSQTESSDSSKPEESSSSTEQNSSETSGSNSETSDSNSETSDSNSETSDSISETSSSSTPESSSKPQSSSSKPQSSSSKPQSSSSKPTSSSSKPQSSSSKPQSSSSKPQSSSTTTTTPTPSTNVVDWSKIPYADEFDFNYKNYGSGVQITDYTGTETVVKIPETINGKPVLRIGNSAFAYKENITDLKVPSAVTVLAAGCFDSMYQLRSIELPAGLQEIGGGAFCYCRSLKRLTIPDSVVNIDKENKKMGGLFAFGDSASPDIVYKRKTYDKDHYYALYDTVNYPDHFEFGYRDNPKELTILLLVSRALTTAKIPSNVTEIDTIAFDGCKDLTSVVIPEGVTSIWSSSQTDSRGFPGCTSLKSLTLPDSLTSIELKALGRENVNGIETITWKGRTYKRSQFERLCQDVCNS